MARAGVPHNAQNCRYNHHVRHSRLYQLSTRWSIK